MSLVKILVSLTILIAISLPAKAQNYRLETISDGLDYPWSVAFLPSGNFLVSFLGGELREISVQGDVGQAIENLPSTYRASQGGFFDVVLDPNFQSNRTIYLAFAHGTAKQNGTRVISARYDGSKLVDVRPIFTVKNNKDTPVHYGGRLLFMQDGTLLLTTGDGFNYRETAQDPFNQMGKIVRMNKDGSVPADNPFADGQHADPYVYTLGHRNPQGLTHDSTSNTIYMHEHGPRGGDEVNTVKAGDNYGWPVTTDGVNYSGAKISPFRELEGITAPTQVWTPSVAPSGMAYYSGTKFSKWRNSLFVGTLVNKDVRRLQLEQGKVVGEQILFSEIDQRIRDVRTGPDGLLYLLTEDPAGGNGQLIRVSPK